VGTVALPSPPVSDLGASYRQARESVAELIRSLSPDQLGRAVPACPDWTVHDVVAHMTGVASDVITGRLTGIPSESQTAAQVADRAGTPTSVVLREWERSASQLEALMAKGGRSNLPPVADVVVHEQDIRGALGLPGNRDTPLIDLVTAPVARLWESKIDSAGLAPVVVMDGERVLYGSAEAPVQMRTSRFEFFRAAYGRRSRAQIERRFSGTDDPGAYVDLLCVFGPAESDLVE
jgi:uncharacterized protein (TIGR03083 family)